MSKAASYEGTRARVEDYFDRTATQTWARLTSDAPVSRIRQTVREGRDTMRALMLDRLPNDLRGMRILDAGCGPGVMTGELAARGANVLGVDISPQLIGIAEKRLDPALRGRVAFHAGDMLDPTLGSFDAVMAMDSLIYYSAPDLSDALEKLSAKAPQVVFTVAPKTTLLMAFWYLGKVFPKSDRSPTMVPHSRKRLARDVPGLIPLERVARGFYISEAMEVRR